jgi:hypothetical protein
MHHTSRHENLFCAADCILQHAIRFDMALRVPRMLEPAGQDIIQTPVSALLEFGDPTDVIHQAG